MIHAAVLACLLGVAAALAKIPFYARLLDKPAPRFAAVDGLRGLLALGVFFHHAELTQNLLFEGHWQTNDGLVGFLGRAPVACFFSVTGLLFWDKVLKVDGRLDVLALYRSRVRRIVPMYVVSVLAVFGCVAAVSGFTLRVPPRELLDSVLAWAFFGAVGFPDVNGVVDTSLISARVHWTLAYEWAFYLALPFLALFRRGFAFGALLILGVVFIGHLAKLPMVTYFMVGMVSATVLHDPARWPEPVQRAIRHASHGGLGLLLSFAAFGCLGVAALSARGGHLGVRGVVLLAVFFAVIASGNTLFGLLTCRPVRLLGTLSYSLYVLQGIALFAAHPLWRAARGSALGVCAVEGLSGLLLVLVSAATYAYVEHPFLARRPEASLPRSYRGT